MSVNKGLYPNAEILFNLCLIAGNSLVSYTHDAIDLKNRLNIHDVEYRWKSVPWVYGSVQLYKAISTLLQRGERSSLGSEW